jgi:hypothetical protein
MYGEHLQYHKIACKGQKLKMAYAQAGTIEATDYNSFINGSNQLNRVWGVGTGDAGYGQTVIPEVTAGFEATATQWATLINALNNVRQHQTGSGSGISSVSAGQTINYYSALSTSINSAYSDRLLYASQGSTTTGSNFDSSVVSGGGISNYTVDRTVTFASVDAARYFFNAGGQLNLVLSTVNGTDSGSENSFTRLVNAIGGIGFRATDNTGRTGSGITLNTNLTTHGYYDNVFNSPTTVVQVTDTTTGYTASTMTLATFTSNSGTTNGGKGLNVVFRTNINIADKTWDDSISLTYRQRIDIVYPETTYLTDVWGTPTVS